VRELYAVQLRGTHQTRNATAWGQIRTWAERHTGFDIPSDGGTTQQPVHDQIPPRSAIGRRTSIIARGPRG